MQTKLLIMWLMVLTLLPASLTLGGTDGMGGLEITETQFEIEWNYTYGGEGGEIPYTLIQTSDGGFAIAGYSNSLYPDLEAPGAMGSDFFLLKIDGNGQFEWNMTYPDSGDDQITSIIQTSDDGLVLFGVSGEWPNNDLRIMKTDSAGTHEWNRTFGGFDMELAHELIKTSDGGFAMAGSTNSYGAGQSDIWLIKTDANGQHQWNETFGGTGIDQGGSVIQTSDNGFVVVGSTDSYGAGQSDIWLIKTDTNGQHQWNKTFGGFADDGPSSVIQTSDNGFIIGGNTESFGLGKMDYWLLKTDLNGDVLWEYTFGSTNWLVYDMVSTIIQMPDGNIVIAGMNDFGIWLVKTDLNGNFIADASLELGTWFLNMIQTSDNGFLISMGLEVNGDNWDFNLIKIAGPASETSTSTSDTASTHTSNDDSDNGFLAINLILLFSPVLILGVLNGYFRRKRFVG